jgi:hypothetical protein
VTVERGMVEEMAFAEVRINPADGTVRVIDSLRLAPSFGPFGYTDLDLGFPSVRESSQELPDADGTFDDTQYHGARAVSVAITVAENMFSAREVAAWDPRIGWNSAAYWVQVLGAWMRPSRRFRLYYKLTGQGRRWVDVRPANGAAPIVMDRPGSRDVQLSLVSPSGRLKSFSAGVGSTIDGRNYRKVPLQAAGVVGGQDWPIDWTAGGFVWGRDQTTPNDVYYDGTVATGFVVRMNAGTVAPLQNPRFTVTGPDGVARTKGFTMTVPVGSWATIDSETRETFLNHDRTSTIDRYYSDPLAGTSEAWPVLSPGYNVLAADGRFGLNRVSFSALSAGSDAFYELLWHESFIL